MHKNINKILLVLSFFIPFVVYILTMAPTVSFWDCGEFIATSYILGVPHPPGAPFYLLLGNIFSSLPLFDDIGARINFISPIASALSVMFLYLIIVYLIEEYRGKAKDNLDSMINYGSAFTASLTFAFTDSHWFNAVEAEVYSVSTFFTSIVVWMILKWSKNHTKNWNLRYLLIIIYMLGLAIGVHLLNLLTLPFVMLIIYFKKFNFNIKTFIAPVLLSLIIFITIYIGIIKGIPDLMNKLNGNLFFIILLPVLIITSIALLILKKKNKFLNIYAYCFSAISFCFISFLIANSLLIKSPSQLSDNLHIKLIDIQNQIDLYDKEIYKLTNQIENNRNSLNQQGLKDKVNTLITTRNNQVDEFKYLYDDYISFEKLKNNISFVNLLKWQPRGSIFLIVSLICLICFIFYRSYNSSNYQFEIVNKFIFSSLLLVLIGYSTYILIFIRAEQYPRINENNPNTVDRALSYMNRDQYGDWDILNWKSTMSRAENTNWKRYTLDKNNPTFNEQMNFFFNYQVSEMYLRYFAWQFIGRGDKEDFPWYISDLNGNLIGNEKLDGINTFRYGIPLAFIFGLFGLFIHFKKDPKRAFAVLSLFLATGLLIIIYLNQYDPQPRERDYSFVGSFFTFSIWIGIGLSAFLNKVRKIIKNNNISSFFLTSLLVSIFIFMPMKILGTDYFEHNRNNNFVAWDYGYNLLNSCEPNGIIFTNGDNDTFPLWYLQEVENIRRDVKVINLSLLNTPWYIEQLMKHEPQLEFDFSKDIFSDDIYKIDPWYATESAFELCGQKFNEEESWSKLECTLNSNNPISFTIRPTLIGRLLRVQDYMILKIINDINVTRPIYFAATVAPNNQIGLERYLSMEGMTYRVILDKNKINPINYKKMKQNLIESNLEKIIKDEISYTQIIESGEGIYRYSGLDDNGIYFNDNIKRLVQNYRIGFIRLAQYDIKEGNYLEAENLISVMDSYFPPDMLEIEPGLVVLISDSIYGSTNNTVKQLEILKRLFNKKIDIQTEIYLLHKLAELNDLEFIKQRATVLFTKNSENLNFELQKYIGDILSDNLESNEFIFYCNELFKEYKPIGLLYSIVRVYDELGESDKAISLIEDFLNEYPQNNELIQLYDYLIQINSIN
tara:strand:+ start:851 stop:4216 length:3366 start_codon:yes stop_codon:yes gene_type:complete